MYTVRVVPMPIVLEFRFSFNCTLLWKVNGMTSRQPDVVLRLALLLALTEMRVLQGCIGTRCLASQPTRQDATYLSCLERETSRPLRLNR